MSYQGKRTGYRKVLQTVTVRFNGANQAQISYNGGAFGALTACSTATWLELFTSGAMSANVNFINTGDDIGELISIGTGGTDGAGNAAADTVFISELGGIGYQPVRIDGGTRLTIKPTYTNPTSVGSFVINFFA